LIRQVGQRINRHYKSRLKIVATKDRARALDGADAAIASIGVHGPSKQWHKLDVEAVAQFGIMQTTGDTVGPSGISQGLRIIPIFVDLAKAMERYCPGCFLLNHSNPMGPICRAVTKTSSIPIIGYCHNVAGGIGTFAKVLGAQPSELD
ncbi:MAG: alpha-glucosidase/alpha-galactosidase, partial [Kiritimatiellia bacterium]